MPARTLWRSTAITGLVLGVWMMGAAPVTVSKTGDTGRNTLLQHRETPDDPPGKPARPVAGSLPSAPVQFGPFTHVQVNCDSNGANIPGDAANEPSIAADPTNPNRIAIGWRQFDTITSNFRQAGWAYSENNGRTWTFAGVLEPGVFRSDPVLDYDAAGNFFYNSLKVIGGVYTCQVFGSTDGGVSWSEPAEALGGDKAWMTIDRTGGIGDGHIYQAWSTAAGCCGDSIFNRSTDGGNTFSRPTTIPASPIWGTLAVASDGTLYVAGAYPGNMSIIIVAKSTTAQNPSSSLAFDSYSFFSLGGYVTTGGGGGGPNPSGLMGQVWIAVDRSSGPTAGYVYVLCSVDPDGNDPAEVRFSRSTDGGATWSYPVTINDDPVGNNAWQWFGTMSVAPNGRIDVIWNDTRNTLMPTLSELYYATSTDGGVTWSLNQQISPWFDSHVGWPNQSKLGDYYDMISDDVGANLAWAATFNDEQDVYYTRIGDYDCNANGVGDSLDIALGTSPDVNTNGIPDECEGLASSVRERAVSSYRLLQNVPNPFNPATAIRFAVPPSGGSVKLQVFNVEGRLVKTLVDGYRAGGEQSILWDGTNSRGRRVSSGLYFYRLEAPGFLQVRKMILLK